MNPRRSPRTVWCFPVLCLLTGLAVLGVLLRAGAGESAAQDNDNPADHWAFQPVQHSAIPAVPHAPSRVGNPIDAFILRKLDEAGLKPAPPADKRTLIRRATFDLTGLPPTPDEIDAFLADDSPRAFEKVIDRLLASPHYGEQWARHWLDVVRYADTAGFANDFERPNAWRYRDYVIRSFNEDTPFDRFILEQIAGDELDPDNPQNLIAVGFLRMGPWEHTGMSVAAVTRQQYLDDVTNSVGQTFLGTTLRCARCHDHKFDPIPTRDYYRMQAVFAPVQFADRRVPFLPVENVSRFAERTTRTNALLKQARDYIASLVKKNKAAVASYLKERGVPTINDLPEKQRPPRHLGLTPLEMSLQKLYRKRIDYYERELMRYEPLVFSVYDGPLKIVRSNDPLHEMPAKRDGVVQAVHILRGGSLAAPAEEVAPGVLSAVPGSNDLDDPNSWNTIPEAMNGRRLAMARWIASTRNPLTVRVIVNRVWQHHFGGKGIVATPNNFGKTGAKPTHAELLDWLAWKFSAPDTVETADGGLGWSIKKLHRLMMTSQTYQRSSQDPDQKDVDRIDPDDKLLAHYPPRRLAAEEIRDSLLAVAGELNPEMGGPGIFPAINWEVALQARHIMGSVAPAYQPSLQPGQRHRRTIYAFRYRTLSDPMLDAFDRPGSDLSCARRDETTVTPQVFALFNGEFVHDRALALANRIARRSVPDARSDRNAASIEQAFHLVYGRPPTRDELQMCRDHVARMLKYHQQHEPAPVALPTKVTRHMVEELTGEPFEWQEELPGMADYQRDLKPADVPPPTRALAELCLVLFNSNEFLYVR